MCEAVLHSHTGLRVSTNFQGGNFLTKWRFQRNVTSSHLASRDAQRRRSFPSTFITKFSYLLFHPNRLTVAAFQRIHHIRFRERCLAVRADPTDMQIDARCASTSSARFNTTTSCTAVVPGASDAGLSAPRLTCNAMSTGAPIPRSIDGNF